MTQKTLLEQTAEEMIRTLKEYAKEKNVSEADIRSLFAKQNTDGLNALDDLFHDGGEGRVDYFSTFSMDYANNFSKDVTSDEYDERRWEVELKAMKEF